PVADIRTLEDWLGDSAARPRFNMVLLMLLAGVALTLAIAGVYGVVSYAVIQRTQEMGIRMALGAAAGDILRLVLKEGSRLILAGLLAGAAATVALTRLMKSMLFETSTTDPLTLVSVAMLLMLAALIACWVPSRCAAKVDPVVALRYE
ncbi:MAG TPA: FtsX-like permease family protein, partial [Acidobacteriota bacterium]|nr:FtsX-like permease family protein [Acidobacteriota bacterium]